MAIIEENGTSYVTVKKNELIAALEANMKTHVADFIAAKAGFEREFVREAEVLLTRAKSGDFEKDSIDLTKPESHEREYMRVLRMLKMSTAEEIRISQGEFAKYVEDDWSWKLGFETMSKRYGGEAGAGPARR